MTPSFLIAPYELSVLVSDNITLQCQTIGIPTPLILWLKDGQLLAQSDATIIYNTTSDTTANSTLIITNVTNTDDGVYICEASNKVGTNRIQFNVTVSGIV